MVHSLPDPGSRIKNDYVTIKEDTSLFMVAERFNIKGYTYPSHGEISYNKNNGFYTYTPDENFTGEDFFLITTTEGKIRVFVDVVSNESPEGTSDGFTVNKNSEISFTAETLLNNDTDPEEDSLNITGFTAPEHGRLERYPNEISDKYIYTPNANYTGTDSFLYTVSDGNGGIDVVNVNIDVKDSLTAKSQVSLEVAANNFSGQIHTAANSFEYERMELLKSLGI